MLKPPPEPSLELLLLMKDVALDFPCTTTVGCPVVVTAPHGVATHKHETALEGERMGLLRLDQPRKRNMAITLHLTEAGWVRLAETVRRGS